MLETYFLRYKNIIIGKFINNHPDLAYIPNAANASSIPNGLGYPIGLYPLDKSRFNRLVPDTLHKPEDKDIRRWLSDRVFPREREGVSALLDALGLSRYDVWEIAKRTHAVTMHDHYWMSDSLQDTFEKIHPRYLLSDNELYGTLIVRRKDQTEEDKSLFW